MERDFIYTTLDKVEPRQVFSGNSGESGDINDLALWRLGDQPGTAVKLKMAMPIPAEGLPDEKTLEGSTMGTFFKLNAPVKVWPLQAKGSV